MVACLLTIHKIPDTRIKQGRLFKRSFKARFFGNGFSTSYLSRLPFQLSKLFTQLGIKPTSLNQENVLPHFA